MECFDYSEESTVHALVLEFHLRLLHIYTRRPSQNKIFDIMPYSSKDDDENSRFPN